MNELQLKNKIMRRVYFLHTIRKVKGPIMSKLVLFAVFLLALSSLVSVPSIIANMPHSFGSLYSFIVAAFLNTQFAVQAILLLACVVGLLLIKDAVTRNPLIRRLSF
jgi:hypothetical protein